MPIILLCLSLLLARPAGAAGPSGLAELKKDQLVAKAFHAAALYLDPSGEPKGARFVHDRGLTVDVLFFDSVPQVSVYFRTPPADDRGAPHTLEHLLLGKGSEGRKLNTLMPMRMGTYTAGTYSDLTNYQFSTAAGPAEFYELLGSFLTALIRPNITDEEMRREIAHTAVVEEGGQLKLEEKGTVYTEMVARTEQPGSICWDQLGDMMYGPAHPLALNQGGEPAEIWKLTPADVRAFHAARYHLDGNMELIAALPQGWDAAAFLARLNDEILRLEPRPPARAYPGLPPFAPRQDRAIRIGGFPSDGAPAPQDAFMAWPPVRAFGKDDNVRAALAADLLGGGETSYLYRDLIDRKTRKFDSGATGVGAGAQALPASYAMLWFSGLPAAGVTPAVLGRLRDLVGERVRWLHGLKPGSPELAEAAEKARARIRSSRRAVLKAMEGPPQFGERFSGDSWHRALDQLAAEPGFEKSLSEDAALDRLLAEVDAGQNPWAAALERAGMLQQPYVSAVLPDAALMDRQKALKQERLKAAAAKLAAGYALPAAEALQRYRAETDSATAELEALERGAPEPSFLREPPLELDQLAWSESLMACGARLVRTQFQTPFTDISVNFDLRGVPEGDRELLPLLGGALGSVGVITRAGERLDYAAARERIMAEIYDAGVGVAAYPRSDRAELSFSATASSPEEVDRAVAWIENYLLRPGLTPAARERLIDTLRAGIQGWRGIFQQDEESWVSGAVAAYRYQDRPLYMNISSPFTVLRNLNRLRWRLEDPAPARLAALRSTAAGVMAAAKTSGRASVEKLLARVDGELGEYLRWEFAHLPEDSWRADLQTIASDFLADVGHPAETIRRLQALAAGVLVRTGTRVHINGNAANSDRAARQLETLLDRLPRGRQAAAPPRKDLVTGRLRQRLPGIGRPAHVALVNNSGKTGTISIWTPAAGYNSFQPGDLPDALALGILAGGGAHSLFMRTWGAGLAYSNGLGLYASIGQARYYADKCPDPAQTLRFAAGVAADTKIEDTSQLEYSLATSFADYRAAGSFSSRGAALAYDLEEGNRPEAVHAYKYALLELARRPGTLTLVRARFLKALGRVLVGLPGGRISDSPQAGAFLTGPDSLIRSYESFVREKGEAEEVVRLYPRDFWP
ncbi:MAG: hypothetical protein NTY45_05115 [Elusimicrobia bacterium]|nr:hypothetical protein [Elusimicrobiota bacterium]